MLLLLLCFFPPPHVFVFSFLPLSLHGGRHRTDVFAPSQSLLPPLAPRSRPPSRPLPPASLPQAAGTRSAEDEEGGGRGRRGLRRAGGGEGSLTCLPEAQSTQQHQRDGSRPLSYPTSPFPPRVRIHGPPKKKHNHHHQRPPKTKKKPPKNREGKKKPSTPSPTQTRTPKAGDKSRGGGGRLKKTQ